MENNNNFFTKTKDTELTVSNWSNRKIGDILKELNIRVKNNKINLNQIPILSMTRYYGLIPQSDKFGKRVASKDISNYKIVKKNNIVYGFPMDEGVIYALKKYDLGIVSPIYIVWEKIKDDVNIDYLDILLRSKKLISIYTKLESRTVDRRRIVSKSDFVNIPVQIPPLVEQRGIAEVLDTVDEAIQRTDDVIAKAEELKRGLMQRLLARGIGHTEFKQTELGKIPETWEILPIEKISQIKGRIGWRGYTKKDLRNDGPLTIGAENINNYYEIDLKKNTHITVEKYNESPEIQLNKNDVIMVQRGMTIGKVAIIDREIGKATINPSLVILKGIKINPFYLFYYLISEKGQLNIKQNMTQTGVQMITQEQIKKIKIAIPPTIEQERISHILQNVSEIRNNFLLQQNKNLILKNGLMQFLLSGKIRVRLDNGGLHRIRDS